MFCSFATKQLIEYFEDKHKLTYPSGRRGEPAKLLDVERPVAGSNPAVSSNEEVPEWPIGLPC